MELAESRKCSIKSESSTIFPAFRKLHTGYDFVTLLSIFLNHVDNYYNSSRVYIYFAFSINDQFMRIVKLFFSFLISGLLISCSHTVSLVAVNEKMVLIAPNVFADKTMPNVQQQQLLATLRMARGVIQQFFGSIEANPTVYVCITPSCAGIFGGVKAKAKAYGASKILLTAEGLDSITIIHELAHIELHKRIGSQQAWHKIPMWFDEGLAVLICDDARYGETQWQKMTSTGFNAIALDDLVTDQQWIHAVQQGKWPYGIARKAVYEWYAARGHQALEALILRMKQGKGFSLHESDATLFSKHL